MCANCDLILDMQVEWEKGERPMVLHYAGCSFCANKRHSKLSDGVVSACLDEMAKALVRTFTFHSVARGCEWPIQHYACPV